MKILIVNTNDNNGGAAKAAYRLHKSLLSIGITSIMVVRNKQLDDETILAVPDFYQGRAAFFDALPYYGYAKLPHILYSTAETANPRLVHYINNSDADVVHIHWVAQGFLSLEDIGRITKPLVFSLHDMWLFTGGCHYSGACEAYLSHCQACPALQSEQIDDLSHNQHMRKRQLFQARPDITIVGLSHWIAQQAKRSAVLTHNPVHVIPNPIDTERYKPQSKHAVRKALALPHDKPILIFAADGGTKDPRKGYQHFEMMLSHIAPHQEVHVLTLGNNHPEIVTELKDNCVIEHMPAIASEAQMIKLLNVADVVILPSEQENLSNIVLESLCCNTPVVAFDIGGNGDMIQHLENGYLARFNDSQDMANGVLWALTQLGQEKKAMIREKIIENFSYPAVAKRYHSLYESLPKLAKPCLSLPQGSLVQHNDTDFELTTYALETWLNALIQSQQYFIIYGFGVLGKYLYRRLSTQCVGVIDRNAGQLETRHPDVSFITASQAKEDEEACILVSVYDPTQAIHNELRAATDNHVISLLSDKIT